MSLIYKDFLKRIIDICLSIVGLIILSPVIVILIIILFFANDGKPFFIQKRPGKNGQIIKTIKFKTMADKCDSMGRMLPDVRRLTRIGRIIRKMSLDETPQLINVLKGDMSIIGPRPLLLDYLELYSEFQNRRHEVKPGITGWAQINGRNAISWEEKFKYDVWYVDNVSFWLDIKILFLTFVKVIKRENIFSSNTSTMEMFLGSGPKAV